MRHGTFLFLLLLLTLSLTAQTRRIALRSHGGSPNTFAALLDDDHGGNPAPNWDRKDEKWNVHPFIAKVRKHYENEGHKVKNTDTPKAETKDSVRVLMDGWGEPQVIPPDDNKKQQAPEEASILPATPDDDNGSASMPSNLPEITPFRLARQPAEAPAQGNMTLWLFAGALILTIAPAMYWITRRVA